MRKYVLLSVLVLFAIVSQLVFFIYVVRTYDDRVSRFRVEERLFRNAVNQACTNFLATYIVNYTNVQSSSSSSSLDVRKVDLSTWLDYSRVPHCLIEGVAYSVGDYTPFGLILQIADGRVYCRRGGDIVILRSLSKDDRLPRSRSEALSASDGAAEAARL